MSFLCDLVAGINNKFGDKYIQRTGSALEYDFCALKIGGEPPAIEVVSFEKAEDAYTRVAVRQTNVKQVLSFG